MPRMLEAEYELFNRRRAEFEEEQDREWVVICGEEVAGFFPDLEEAALAAIDRYGPEGPYLIEQIGVEKRPLPLSLFQRPMYA